MEAGDKDVSRTGGSGEKGLGGEHRKKQVRGQGRECVDAEGGGNGVQEGPPVRRKRQKCNHALGRGRCQGPGAAG